MNRDQIEQNFAKLGVTIVMTRPSPDEKRRVVWGHRPTLLIHELAHGFECPKELIGKNDFGLTECHLYQNIVRECRAMGYQAALCEGMTDGRGSVSERLMEQVEDYSASLVSNHPSPWEPGYLNFTLCMTNAPSPDRLRDEFRRYYGLGLEYGYEGAFRAWQEKLQ